MLTSIKMLVEFGQCLKSHLAAVASFMCPWIRSL